MVGKRTQDRKDTDGLLKAMLVFSRSVDEILERRTVDSRGRPLSRSCVQILRLLGRRGGQTATQLARFLGVSKPAVSQIVDTMVRNRLVTRRKSKQDGRGVELYLTSRGRDLFKELTRDQRHLVRSAARHSAPVEIAKWIEALNEMAGALAGAGRAFERLCLQCGAHADGTCVLVGGPARCLLEEYEQKRGKTPSTSAGASQRRRAAGRRK